MSPTGILYIINNAEIGGGPQHLAYLLRYLDRSKYDAVVVCTGGGGFMNLLRQQGVRVMAVDLMRWHTHAGAVRQITEIIRSTRAGLVHTHGTRAGLLGGLAARITGTSCVYTLHATRANRDDRMFSRWAAGLIEKGICRMSSKVISVSEANRRFCIERGYADERKVVTIPNGLPLAEWTTPPTPIRDTPWTIGMIGRLDRQKGVLFFIEAAAEVHRQDPSIRFVIIGDGRWSRRARDLAQRRFLSPVLRFTGWMPDTRAAFSLMDMVVLPSLWEGLPFVALEGMALRRPVIATRVNGLPEVITHGRNGLLVPPADPQALADAVLELVNDPARTAQFTETAYGDVRARFDAKVMTERTMAVYKEVLKIDT